MGEGDKPGVTAEGRKMKMKMLPGDECKSKLSGFNVGSRSCAVSGDSKNVSLTYYSDAGGPLSKIVLIDSWQAPVPIGELYLCGILPISMNDRMDLQLEGEGRITTSSSSSSSSLSSSTQTKGSVTTGTFSGSGMMSSSSYTSYSYEYYTSTTSWSSWIVEVAGAQDVPESYNP